MQKQEALRFERTFKEQTSRIHVLEAEIRNHERCSTQINALQQELEDSKFDLMESDRARSWLSNRLATTSASSEKKGNEILTLKAIRSWKFYTTTSYFDRKSTEVRRKHNAAFLLKGTLHSWKLLALSDTRKLIAVNYQMRWKQKRLKSTFSKLHDWSKNELWRKINSIKFRFRCNQKSSRRIFQGWVRLWAMSRALTLISRKASER